MWRTISLSAYEVYNFFSIDVSTCKNMCSMLSLSAYEVYNLFSVINHFHFHVFHIIIFFCLNSKLLMTLYSKKLSKFSFLPDISFFASLFPNLGFLLKNKHFIGFCYLTFCNWIWWKIFYSTQFLGKSIVIKPSLHSCREHNWERTKRTILKNNHEGRVKSPIRGS